MSARVVIVGAGPAGVRAAEVMVAAGLGCDTLRGLATVVISADVTLLAVLLGVNLRVTRPVDEHEGASAT